MRNLYLLKIVVVLFISLNLWSCEEEPASIDCTPLATAISDALAGFTGDLSEENCGTFVTALQAAIDDGCDVDGTYQTQLNYYNCDCIDAEADILAAYTNFISDPTTPNCTTYNTTLQSAIDGSCDPNGVYQVTIDALGDCSVPSSGLVCVELLFGVTTGNLNYAMDPSEATCNSYKDSLSAAINGGCDTDDALQIIFDGLDCAFDSNDPASEIVSEANAALENILNDLFELEENEPDSIQEIMDALDFSDAYQLYTEAQALNPTNDDANFGVAITGLMQVTQDEAFKDMIDSWDNYFANNTPFEVQSTGANILGRNGFGLPLNTNGLRIPISPFLGAPLSMARMTLDDVPQFSELQDIIRNVFLPYVDSGIAALASVETNPDYVFFITSAMQPDVEASSLELDLTEVYAIDMMLHAVKAICNTVIAYNFDFATHDGAGIVAELNTNSDFAALNSLGFLDLSTAFSAMNSAIDKLEDALDFLEAESDDQGNDMIVQMVDPDDYTEVRDGIDLARDAISEPTWIYYTEAEYDTWYEPEIEDSIQVDIQQFFANPIQDFKTMVPPYTITAGIDTSYDWDWTNGYENIEVTVEGDSQYVSFYYGYNWDYDNNEPYLNTSGDVPEEVANAIDAFLEELMNNYQNITYLNIYNYYSGFLMPGDNDITLEISWSIEWEEEEGMFYYPVITWDADTFDEWKAGWPDHTFNGIFPSWTIDEMMEFIDIDEEEWEKTWD